MSAVSSLRQRYPLGVIVVGAIAFFRAITIVADITEVQRDGVFGWIANSGPLPDMPPGTDVQIVALALLWGLLIASILVVVGLALGQRWAWVLAIITSGVILAARPRLVVRRRAAPRLDAPELDRGLLPEPARCAARAPRRTRRAMNQPTDLELLRRLEPILRFTDGELFFPMATSSYVEQCDLLAGPSLREARVVVPVGELDLEKLAAVGDPAPGEAQFLRFVPEPLSALELRRWRSRPEHQRFSAPGRLARVGLAARLVDAGMVTSLLARGRVPGGTAAAASVRYEQIRERDPRVVYHGRVIREGRWVILHYMFFYAMNDWRSTFDGANDHEADLEQCFVVLEQFEDGTMKPAWFCAAAHDEKGDDLRRRWDDPRLETIDDHPVVYPGAGSHATYLERGEYIMLLPFPGERNVRGPLDLIRRVWRDTLAQPDPGDIAARAKRALSVPFVDYARGDGLSVGPGADVDWTPIIISDEDGWVSRYQGLWGLDTGDRFAGERAPAGPKYTRTGTVRQSWHDPLGFAGLDKVAPPSQAIPTLEAGLAEVARKRDEVDRGGRGPVSSPCPSSTPKSPPSARPPASSPIAWRRPPSSATARPG